MYVRKQLSAQRKNNEVKRFKKNDKIIKKYVFFCS